MKILSIALISLALVSACGQRGASPETGEKPSGDIDQAAAVAQADQAASNAAALEKEERERAALADAAAKRAATYKRALLPLVAAAYTGDCSTGAGAKTRSAITVGADGTVSAPGMKASSLMDPDVMFTLSRGLTEGTAPTASLIAGSDENKWTVHLGSNKDGASGYASNNEIFNCLNVPTAVQSKPGAVYATVAKFFIAAPRVMQCNDFASLTKTVKVTPSASQVTVGGDTFSLVRGNGVEIAIVTASEKALTYQTGAIDEDMIMIQLDETGALGALTVQRGAGEKSLICEPGKQ